MSEPISPEAELAALQDLVKSEGWAIYMAHVARAWGADACEAALRASRKKIRDGELAPEEWPFESARILDAFAAMRADTRWPEDRIRALKDGEQAKKASVTDRFKEWRRA